MKIYSLATLTLCTCLTLPALAISDKDLARECRETAIEKIVTQAAIYECAINIDDVQVADIDNRFYNASKYIWYTVATQCDESPRTSITKLVQYSDGQCN